MIGFCSVKRAAIILNVSTRTIWRYVKSGDLRAYSPKKGGKYKGGQPIPPNAKLVRKSAVMKMFRERVRELKSELQALTRRKWVCQPKG